MIPRVSVCQNYRRGSSDIDGMIIALLGRMMILYSSEWRIYTITALSAPYNTISVTVNENLSRVISLSVKTIVA
jgi:hypothetical protein